MRDLIRQLEFYEKLEHKQSLQSAHERAKRRVQSYSRFTADDIINLAHEEYIEDCVLRLKENLSQIFEKEEKDARFINMKLNLIYNLVSECENELNLYEDSKLKM